MDKYFKTIGQDIQYVTRLIKSDYWEISTSETHKVLIRETQNKMPL